MGELGIWWAVLAVSRVCSATPPAARAIALDSDGTGRRKHSWHRAPLDDQAGRWARALGPLRLPRGDGKTAAPAARTPTKSQLVRALAFPQLVRWCVCGASSAFH